MSRGLFCLPFLVGNFGREFVDGARLFRARVGMLVMDY